MIRIPFIEPLTKIWRRWIKECEAATDTLLKAYKSGKQIEISDIYRRKSIKETVFFSKDGPFRGRCAYCETYLVDFQHGDVEHFRPKKAVTDESGNPVTFPAPDGTQVPHPGYYWLAYNWHNLLPSCITCNQPGDEGIGKHNRFPVEAAKYAMTANEIPAERPLLLNPADPGDDDPEDHLDVDLDTGFLKYKNGSPRGKACIEIFGLNKRDQLVQERKAAIAEVKAKYAAIIFADTATRQLLLSEIKAMEAGLLSYTLVRRAQSRVLTELFSQTPRRAP